MKMSREQWGNGYYAGIKKGLKAKVSFYDYCIIMHDGEDTIYGDFVYDMKHDDHFPKSVDGRLQYVPYVGHLVPYREDQYCKCIMDYLTSYTVHACRDAIVAFAKLWKEWKGATA